MNGALMDRHGRGCKSVIALVPLLLAICATGLHAQETESAAAPAPTSAVLSDPTRAWHLFAGFGAGGVNGGYGEFLETPYHFELSIFKERAGGRWRLGGGLQFGSMEMSSPYEDQKEWAHLETFFGATRFFRTTGRIRPYAQGRLGLVRIHPRSEIFYNKDPEGLEPGESPTLATNGLAGTLLGGAEVGIGRGVGLDVSGYWTAYKTKDYDLEPIGKESVGDGNDWGIKTGITWHPLARSSRGIEKPVLLDPDTGQPLPLPPPDGDRDEWGIPRSWGWATAEMLAINFGASMINEYVRDANFNQISPRSFWHNLEEGFTWDDNEFRTNQLIHPFNGAAYFNAARGNGIGFWGSSVMALAGAFTWEAFGETHPMSFNDMVSTGIGGIARGEMAHRISAAILDNTARGNERIYREAGAFLVNPVGGFNRLVRGDAGEWKGNPSDPQDWRPPHLNVSLRVGARIMGEGESITENTNYYGFAEVGVAYGSPWDNVRRRPYDRFDVAAGVNIGDKTALGRLLIRGDIFSFPLGSSENHTFAIQQDFDYIDNEAYEYGGQSLGVALQSRYNLAPDWQLWSRLQGYGILLGAVNSDLAFLADVADRERYREYDYGPGVGGSAELYLRRKGRAFFSIRYRYSYINVSNGSVWNEGAEGIGLESDHDVQQLGATLDVPVTPRLALGVDGAIFLRESEYDFTATGDTALTPGVRSVRQRNPEVRAFVAWQW